jgi:mRNA interferase RelE/StbE
LIYRIIVQPVAAKMLKSISDRRVQQKIAECIDGLASDPDKQGKPLIGELLGYRSIRAVGQRLPNHLPH